MKYKVFFSTVVWGEEYIYYFLKFTIKSLFKKNNLSSNLLSKESEFVIFCKKNEINLIKNHKRIKTLKKKIKIRFKYIDNVETGNKYSILGLIQKEAINLAIKNKFQIFIYIYPDSILGENYVNLCLEKHKFGYEAILSPAPLVNSEAIKKIDDKSLINYIFNNLHNFYKSFFELDPNNPIFIYKKKYLYLNCKHLNINSLNIIKKKNIVKKINSYDEDIIKILDIKKKFYLRSNFEFFLISIESKYSERSIKNKYLNLENNLYNHQLNLFFLNAKNNYEIDNLLNGGYIFCKSISRKKLKHINDNFKKKIHNIYNLRKTNFIKENFMKKKIVNSINEDFKNYKYIKSINILKKNNGLLKFYLLILFIYLPELFQKFILFLYSKGKINFGGISNRKQFSFIQYFLLNKKISFLKVILNYKKI